MWWDRTRAGRAVVQGAGTSAGPGAFEVPAGAGLAEGVALVEAGEAGAVDGHVDVPAVHPVAVAERGAGTAAEVEDRTGGQEADVPPAEGLGGDVLAVRERGDAGGVLGRGARRVVMRGWRVRIMPAWSW